MKTFKRYLAENVGTIFLRTRGNERYGIIGKNNQYTLYVPGGSAQTFPTLAKLLFMLGGMVDWDSWTEDSQMILRDMNNGQAI